MHNSRCEYANPKSKCRCRCGGSKHGIARHSDTESRFIRSVNASLGGEAGRTIEILTNVPFQCTCGKRQFLGGFLGYPHTNGLDDKDGNRWWIFYECEKCQYQWNWAKLSCRVLQQKQLGGKP